MTILWYYHAKLSNLVPFHSDRTSLEFLFICPGTSLKKFNTTLYFILDIYDELTCCVEKGVDPDQLASSSEAS